MIGQIKRIEDLRPEDIALDARLAFDARKEVSDCPFEPGTEQDTRWRKAFIALELAHQEEPA